MAKRNLTLPFSSKYWVDNQFCDNKAADIVAWKLARSAIEHENSLVNHRMTWFLQSQAFLFTAFVLLFNATTPEKLKAFGPLLVILLVSIGLFGAFVCFTTSNGLKRAHIATTDITNQYEQLIKDNNADPIVPPLHLWDSPSIFHQHRLPFATMLLWILVVSVCIAIQFPDVKELLLRFIKLKECLIGLIVTLLIFVGIFIGRWISCNSKINA